MKILGIILKVAITVTYIVLAAVSTKIALSLIFAALGAMTGILAIESIIELRGKK